MKSVILPCLVWAMVLQARTEALPTGTVSGRVFDSTGKPMGNAVVALLRVAYTRQARSIDVVDTRATNRRGEFRFDRVPPGEYYLGAAPSATMTHVTTLYPAAANLNSAAKIVVKAGDELNSLDIHIRSLNSP
jgi:hypothetical protein